MRLNAQAAVQIAYEILSVLAPLFCRSVRTDIHPLQRLGIFTASAAMRLIRTLDKIDERLAERSSIAAALRKLPSAAGMSGRSELANQGGGSFYEDAAAVGRRLQNAIWIDVLLGTDRSLGR